MAKNTLTLDTSLFDESIQRLKLDLLEASHEVVEFFLAFVESGGKLFRFGDTATVGASHIATLEPSDFVNDFLTAARAGELKGFIVEYRLLHGGFISSVNIEVSPSEARTN